MLLLTISALLALLPLLGVVYILVSGGLLTVDGLFTSLILLALSGIFGLDALWEARDRGLLPFLRKKQPAAAAAGAPATKPASKSAAYAVGAAYAPAAKNPDGTQTEVGVVENIELYEGHVGEPDRSLVTFRQNGGPARPVMFSGNLLFRLRPGKRVRITYRNSLQGRELVDWEYLETAV